MKPALLLLLTQENTLYNFAVHCDVLWRNLRVSVIALTEFQVIPIFDLKDTIYVLNTTRIYKMHREAQRGWWDLMHDFLQTKLYRWMGNITTPKYIFGNLKAFRGFVKLSISVPIPGRPHSSQNEIPCVFPEFFLCCINFPCVIFA